MKRFSAPVLMLAQMAALGFSSCDKADNDTLSRSAQIVGNWHLTSVAVDINQNGVREDNEVIPMNDPNIPVSATLRFLVDHTGMAFANFGPFDGAEDFKWGFTDFENTLVIKATGMSADLSVVAFQGRNMTLLYQQPGIPGIWEDFQKQ